MPIESDVKDRVLEYCHNFLPSRKYFDDVFEFVEDGKLKDRLALEYYSARYIYKLGEALNASGEMLHAHLKFQITQYASIYEAIINYLLWGKYANHPEKIRIEIRKDYKIVSSNLANNLQLITTDGEKIHLCAHREITIPYVNIRFDDKVDAAIKIGFVQDLLGEEIKEFYKLRNAIHLDSAVKNNVEYEIAKAKLAYRRLQPFLIGVQGFLTSGILPEECKLPAANDSGDEHAS